MRFTRIAEAIGGTVGKYSRNCAPDEARRAAGENGGSRDSPHLDYRLTKMGDSLAAAFCNVWRWAGRHLGQIETARREFDARAPNLSREVGFTAIV